MTSLNAPTVHATYFELEYDRAADGGEVSTAVAELPSGSTLRLRIAEHFLHISELSDVERDLVILAHPAEGTRRQEITAPRIASPDVWHSAWSVDFYGRIEDVDVDPLYPLGDGDVDVLDVGDGAIYVHPSVREHLRESALPLEPGDGLYLPASWIELRDISP